MLSQSLYQKLLHTLQERHLLADHTVGYVENLSVKALDQYHFVAQDALYPVVADVMGVRYVAPDHTWTYIHHDQDSVLAHYLGENWLITSDPWDMQIRDTMAKQYVVHRVALSTPGHIQQFIHKAGVRVADDMWTHLLEEAVTRHATDIHFLQDTHKIHVQFRIHGLLQDHTMIGREQWGSLVNQIKIRALLDITETRRAQSGHLSGIYAGQAVNCRIAIHPTTLGETVTVRILYQHHHIKDLSALGFQEPMISVLHDIIDKPSGLFLITGPTGSGKTTTLYSLFRNHLKDRKIMTLEDPVEYVLPPIQQTEIRHPDIFSYHDGLKSILRHDPDIIFVGEIRDAQTAALTLRAAMTGHLVCATTHTHSVIDALYRFLDFGISQAALGTQLLGILAQQLHPDQNRLRLDAELLLCDPSLRQHLIANKPLEGIHGLINKENFFTLLEP